MLKKSDYIKKRKKIGKTVGSKLQAHEDIIQMLTSHILRLEKKIERLERKIMR